MTDPYPPRCYCGQLFTHTHWNAGIPVTGNYPQGLTIVWHTNTQPPPPQSR